MPVCSRKVDTTEDDEFSGALSQTGHQLYQCVQFHYILHLLVNAKREQLPAVKLDN